MARSISTIQNQIIASVQADATLSQLNSPSRTAIWNLWAYIVAVAIAVFEQILDLATANFETIISNAIVGNTQWWIARMRAFQYSAAASQVVTLVDLVPQYPVINPALQIITQVAITVTEDRRIVIKTAKGQVGSLQPLDAATELVAAQAYVNLIQPAGNNVQVVSSAPDRLYFGATIYYNGQYVLADVKAAVIAAVSNYLFSISNQDFNGSVSLFHLINAVESVPGVEEMIIAGALGRTYAASVGTGAPVAPVYNPVAGYIIPEDTIGYTLDTTLTMSVL